MNASSHEYAQAVVAMNNASVTLLENGNSHLALQLLYCMQDQHFSENLTRDVVTRALNLAQQPPKAAYIMDVHVLRDNHKIEMMDAAAYGPSSSMVFAVRLCEEAVTTVTPYIQAVNLFNLASAYRCHYADINLFQDLVAAQCALRHCHRVLLSADVTTQTPPSSFLWSITACARERVEDEKQRHVEDVSFTSPTMASLETPSLHAVSVVPD